MFNMKINKIVWTDEFTVGIEEMDAQHRQIIAMINEMIDNFEADARSEVVSAMLMKMTHYSLGHLKAEEKLLEEINYPLLEEHKELHNEFKLKVADFTTASTIGVNQVTPAILIYLAEWWTQHILGEDKKYFEYINTQTNL